MTEHHLPEASINLVIRLMCAAGVFVAFMLLAAWQTVPPKTVPANIRGQFLEVAQRLRSFPPSREFFGPNVGDNYVDWPLNAPGRPTAAPGATEYQSLIQGNHPVPILLSLLKDHDPKIRTLAAAALVAKGEPRLQQYLGPLLEDQSQTFDQMWRPPVDNYVPIKFTPQTVATAVLRLVEYRNRADFNRYWAIHAKREYCADWFLWQLRHMQFAPLARQHLQSVPSPDRELITLWIGTGRKFQYDGFLETELVAAAKGLGPERVLDVLRGQPPGTDPDIKPHVDSNDKLAYWFDEHYNQMTHFLLVHAKEVLRPSDAEVLLSLEAEESSRNNLYKTSQYEAWWLIAAASLRPERSDQILDEAEKRYLGVGDIPLARWTIQGPDSLPKVMRWFYGPYDSQERLAVGILVSDPNDQYKPLVEAILASPSRLMIDGEAMYRFAEFAQMAKVNFDQQFVDWIYAQPPDPIPRTDYKSRGGVIEKSGVAQKLVRDSRFNGADGQLLHDIGQSLVGGSSNLSRPQSDVLDSLIKDIDLNHPQGAPETKLQEIRNLLRKDVDE